MRILISGEGKTEIGFWTLEEAHRTANKKQEERGIIEAFLQRLGTIEWEIVEGIDWRRMVKYKARRSDERRENDLGAEGKTVLKLALRADEKQCDAVVFVRDRDDDAEREKEIRRAMEIARDRFSPRMAGGVAAQAIESWLLSLKGEKNAERHGDPKNVLHQRHGIEALVDKVAIIDDADLDRIREDARSLQEWLAQVRALQRAEASLDE